MVTLDAAEPLAVSLQEVTTDSDQGEAHPMRGLWRVGDGHSRGGRPGLGAVRRVPRQTQAGEEQGLRAAATGPATGLCVLFSPSPSSACR